MIHNIFLSDMDYKDETFYEFSLCEIHLVIGSDVICK